MFACFSLLAMEGYQGCYTYTLEVPVNDVKVVKVGNASHDLEELD